MRLFWSCLALFIVTAGIAFVGSSHVSNGDGTSRLPVAAIHSKPPQIAPDPQDPPKSAQIVKSAPQSIVSSKQVTAEDSIDPLALARSLLHVEYSEQACLAGTAKAARPQAMAIHRWTDANGIIHFSDQPPSGSTSGHRRIEVQGLPPIVVHASGYDVNIPDDLNQNAVSAAQAIDRVLRETLGIKGDPGLVLNIEFIASAKAWAARSGSPAMLNAAGTYSTADRTIHIRLQNDKESNFLILRHEITHALVHERIGRLPTAINEGLAGYFEHIKVAGMGAQIALSESRRSLASARIEGNGQDELIDLLAHEGVSFYAAGREQRYLRAFGLVAMLMQTPAGRASLGAVLDAQRRHPCVPIEAERILDANYPGGLPAMALAWADWLNNPPSSVQAF